MLTVVMRKLWVVSTMTFFGMAHADVTVIVLSASGNPVEDAVVVFYDGKTPASNPNAMGKIVQKNKMFNPKVTIVQTGTSINFPNEDSFRHHVYSFSPAKKFELKLYSGVAADPVLFNQAGLVTLGCNIHDSMVGYIYVVDTPFFAKTDDKGRAVIKLSDGQYSYQVLLPGVNKPVAEQKVKIEGATEVKVSIP
ncbi:MULTISPECIES: methylamine utilization protein [unclassified Methylophilus]|uniref:methylamine utilization protein n=1 Tax=unclassified Methylophilus TaxID=2630143 RepID=UPI000A4183E1|nr:MULTISPECIES: methylamine utilization protein [unclassified Methylophilus]